VIDVKELLRELREEPYEKIVIRAPHSGKVEFVAEEPGVRVVGPSGTWKARSWPSAMCRTASSCRPARSS
jgi:hypothetical protein